MHGTLNFTLLGKKGGEGGGGGGEYSMQLYFPYDIRVGGGWCSIDDEGKLRELSKMVAKSC